jgi:pyruvate/2-oxoglutarate dehydrogenase complex dihydrolipoamide acyltransferase (E2) component
MTVKLPRVDQSGTLVILAWLVGTGEPVRLGDPLLTAETDKAVIEVPSPVAGTLVRQLVQAEDEVMPGQAIAILEG